MATEIKVPRLGESVTEATLGKWLKQVGDKVEADEPLVELETDKVTLEVTSPAAGTLSEISAAEGDNVGVGVVIGEVQPDVTAERQRSISQNRDHIVGEIIRDIEVELREVSERLTHAATNFADKASGAAHITRTSSARIVRILDELDAVHERLRSRRRRAIGGGEVSRG